MCRRALDRHKRFLAAVLTIVIIPVIGHFAFNWWYAPRIAFSDLKFSEPFFNRKTEIETVREKLRRPRLVVVLGPHDSGKSHLMKKVLMELQEDGHKVKLLDMRQTESQRLETARKAGQTMDGPAVQAAIRDGISTAVQKMRPHTGKCCLFIDEANLLPKDFPFEELIDLTKQQKSCTIALASSTSSFHDIISKALGARFEFIFVGDLNKMQAAEFWTLYLNMPASTFEEAYAVFGGRMFDLEQLAPNNVNETEHLWNSNHWLENALRGGPGYTEMDAVSVMTSLMEEEDKRGVAAISRKRLDEQVGCTAVDALMREILVIRGPRFVMDLNATPPFCSDEYPLMMLSRPVYVYGWKHFLREKFSSIRAGSLRVLLDAF